jgi:ubiquinone/menaquinone biosynthesis C-methylase UbiE
MPPSLTLDTRELAEKYDVISDKQFEHGKLLLADLDIASGQRVLDIGCGTGRLGEYAATELLGRAGEVVGIEPLALRVEIARRRASANFRVQSGRAEDLSSFESDSFDAVYLNSVYHWLPDKKPALDEAMRVLNPGGRIGISVASRDQPHDMERILQAVLVEHALFRHKGGALPHRTAFSELASQLEGAGFLIKQIVLRSFADVFPDPESVLEFNIASSFGNYLTDFVPDVREKVLKSLRERFALLQSARGVLAYRHLLFAVATKPLHQES